MGRDQLKVRQKTENGAKIRPSPFFVWGGGRVCSHVRMFALVSNIIIELTNFEGAAKVVCYRDGGPLEADQGEQAGAQEVYETGWWQ